MGCKQGARAAWNNVGLPGVQLDKAAYGSLPCKVTVHGQSSVSVYACQCTSGEVRQPRCAAYWGIARMAYGFFACAELVA